MERDVLDYLLIIVTELYLDKNEQPLTNKQLIDIIIAAKKLKEEDLLLKD